MPGRLREGTGFSDKAQGCCNKCCEAVCRLNPWNKLICYSLILLCVASLILLIGGAFATVDSDKEDNICGRNGDLEIPVVRRNAFTWWLANAGVFSIIMIIMTFICCCSYVTLCCGFKLPFIPKLLGVVGFILLIIAFTLFIGWMIFGSYLLSLFGPEAALQEVCRGIIAYLVFMYIYVVVFIGVFIASMVWCAHGTAEDASKKSRESAKSDLKMPNKTLLKAVI